jgi:CDP-paratose 2-epimerase
VQFDTGFPDMSTYSLITGGAGFIGTNLAHHLLTAGRSVLLFDNLSIPGSRRNFEWLRRMHGSSVKLQVSDIRDKAALSAALDGAGDLYHFAAQTSGAPGNPSDPSDVNSGGTLNLLESLRRMRDPPALVFASTHQVYGGLEDVQVRQNGARLEPTDPRISELGIDEEQPVDFSGTISRSSSAADQSVLDYAQQFGLAAVVLRMGCIYGPHQTGTENAERAPHFLFCAIEGRPIVICGDGLQTQDLLYVDDLVDALLLAQSRMRSLSGQVYNVGGGPRNTASLLELLRLIGEMRRDPPLVRFTKHRPGIQRYYSSDTTRFQQASGWEPRTGVEEGTQKLYECLLEPAAFAPRPTAFAARKVVA